MTIPPSVFATAIAFATFAVGTTVPDWQPHPAYAAGAAAQTDPSSAHEVAPGPCRVALAPSARPAVAGKCRN